MPEPLLGLGVIATGSWWGRVHTGLWGECLTAG